MKKYFGLVLAMFLVTGLMAQDGHEGHDHASHDEEVEQPTFLEFEKVIHDFGQVTTEEDAVYEFAFTNSSGGTLLLNPPKTSCGCTTPYYPKEPIEAGEESVLKVKYSTKNRVGPINKQIRVYAQGHDAPIVLTIVGEVLSKDLVQTAPTRKSNSLFK